MMTPMDEAAMSVTITEEPSGGVEGTLNRLDEAVGMLASLHGQPVQRPRKGKVDLAALLWEVAPGARADIQVGEGTTVFGDEGELRRMLGVLLAQGSGLHGKAAPVSLRRVDGYIHVAVQLGPDKAPTFDLERKWLARMAVRHGGRVELHGSTQTLILEAEVDESRREVQALRKELVDAHTRQQEIERELASRSDAPASMPFGQGSKRPPTPDAAASVIAVARASASQLRSAAAVFSRVSGVSEEAADAASALSDLSRVLGALGSTPVGEMPRAIALGDIIAESVRRASTQAAHRGIKVVVEGAGREEVVPVETWTTLLALLLENAIVGSPRDSQVTVGIASGEREVYVEDSGPALGPRAQKLLLSREFEAYAHDRPPPVALLGAHVLATAAQATLLIDAGARGGCRIRVRFGSS